MIRVLLAEDEPGHVSSVEAALERSNGGPFDPPATDRLGSGLAAMADRSHDVVLLDPGLPDSSGIDTLERVISAHPGLPVIVLTGLSDDEMAGEAIRAGAEEHLVKGPGTHATLGQVLRHSVHPRPVREPRSPPDRGHRLARGG